MNPTKAFGEKEQGKSAVADGDGQLNFLEELERQEEIGRLLQLRSGLRFRIADGENLVKQEKAKAKPNQTALINWDEGLTKLLRQHDQAGERLIELGYDLKKENKGN